uniref:ATPase family associated with various cellular activities (AAA) n=1 Tax=Candidatus Kentrum sp. TUN TaxID=2126343 RepID=A0A450ZNC6_9GAMM|nr:MAG: ATPase family associated with various cellular activities (AAA) [Candidatus Kentron sp. TUN]
MASAEQIKALLKSHVDGNDDHFFSIAMQVAAHEAKVGHGKLASELRAIVDAAKLRLGSKPHSGKSTPISQPRGELADLLETSYPKSRLSDMILDDGVEHRINRIIREQKNLAKIQAHGLAPRRKVLLVGPPGTGKTMTASVLAGELGIPLFLVRLDALITKYMGETAAKLRQVFDACANMRGIYFFDEFDAIGSHRGLTNDIGEIRRVLNSFLIMLEQDDSNSVIVAATNHPEILDHALFRRFDDAIQYGLPDHRRIVLALQSRLTNFDAGEIRWDRLAEMADGLSYAEVVRSMEDAIKEAIIRDHDTIVERDIQKALEERKAVRNGRFSPS